MDSTKKQTNVRDDANNVSRETYYSKDTVSALKSSHENKNKEPVSFRKLYVSFRNNGLTVPESVYNALYLKCSDNYYTSGVGIKKRYENIYMHPSAWFSNATTMWRHNKWSIALKLLEIPAVIGKMLHRIRGLFGVFGKGVAEGAESSGSVKKSVSGFASVVFVALIGVVSTYWWNVSADNSTKMPVLQLIIDGEHAGYVASVSDVDKAMDAVEASISVSLGMPYVLDCSVEYSADRCHEAQLLNEAKLNKVMHEAAHKTMILGYGLYKGDIPICAVEDKGLLEECIEESIKRKFPHLINDENVKNIGYKDFLILHGSYPEEFYVNEMQLRTMLSLPELQNGNEGGGVVIDKTLITDGQTVGTSSDVANENANVVGFSVNVEAVITKTETLEEIIPFATEYIYDETLPEGTSSSVTVGRNGLREATYSVDYTDGKETARRMLDETVIREPIAAVKTIGTRPLTEEEKMYKSTGTYIYPNAGSVSSVYGWRTLGGSNEFHKGLDMMSDNGLEIVASDGGTVIQASDVRNGYGLCILIEHDDGTITRYAHCSKLFVNEGQKVKQGQLIAKMGATGFVTGVHLHFEIIKNGATVNPAKYLIPR